jgi:hypothetical protein
VPHDLHPPEGASQLPADRALWLLLQACYTVHKGHTCPLSLRAESLARNQQNRTVLKHHAVSEGGGPPPPLASSALPHWIRSVLDQTPGYRMRHDAAVNYLKNIQAYRQEALEWSAVHVGQGAMPCPASLSMDPPVRHQHRSNGVIIVLDPCSQDGRQCQPPCVPRGGCRWKAHPLDQAGRALPLAPPRCGPPRSVRVSCRRRRPLNPLMGPPRPRAYIPLDPCAPGAQARRGPSACATTGAFQRPPL